MFSTRCIVLLNFLIGSVTICLGQLTVSSGDITISNGQVLTIPESDNLMFACSTTRSGAVITLTTDPDTINVDSAGSPAMRQYTVSDVQRSDNGTQFSCDEGTVVTSFSIEVLFAPDITGMQNVTAYVGEEARIEFSYTANPTAVNATVTPIRSTTPQRLIDEGSAVVTIVFGSVVESDAGEYTVQIENSIGSSNRTFELIVNAASRSISPTTVTSGQSVTTVPETTTTVSTISSTIPVSPSLSVSPTSASNNLSGDLFMALLATVFLIYVLY